MKLVNKFLMGAAVCLAGANSYAASLDIDLFNGEQGVADYTPGNGAETVAEYGFDSTVLGGYRELFADCLSGCQDPSGTLNDKRTLLSVFDGELSFVNDDGVTGTGRVVWDGLGSGGLGTPAGTGIDITQSGDLVSFKLTTLSADAAFWTFTVKATSADNNSTSIEFVATTVPSPLAPTPHISYIPFSGFSACGAGNLLVDGFSVSCDPVAGPGVDLTQLVSLEVEFNSSSTLAVDLTLESVEAVPEPSVMALLGTGLLSLGAMGARRKRKATAA